MSAATSRRVAALRARASHPETPESEAERCRELLARMESTCSCRFCAVLATDPWAAARWRALQADPNVRILCCGAWITTAN